MECFTNPLHQTFQWSLTEISLTFSIAILFLGLSAAFMGHFVEKYGPRASGLFSAIFFGIGMTGSGFAVHMSSLPLLYLFYGVLAGIGLGVGYIAPVSTLVKWFPDRRGLATGLAIMGFGFASLICSPIIQFLIEKLILQIPSIFSESLILSSWSFHLFIYHHQHLMMSNNLTC